MRSRICQERRKEERLHDDLGVGILREPHGDHIQRQKPCGGGGNGAACEARRREIHGQEAEDGPDANGATSTCQSVDPVADGDRGGEQMGKLSNNGAALDVLHEEAHEPQRVVVSAAVRRKEHVACKRRHGRHDRIVNHDRATLRDLDALVHVGSGILAADDVFRRRKEPPRAERDDGQRNDCGPRHTTRGIAQSQPSTRQHSARQNDEEIDEDQPAKTVAVKDGEGENDRQRQRNTEHDRPEAALFRVQRGAAVAIQPGQPEYHRARQPTDQQLAVRVGSESSCEGGFQASH